MQTQQSTTIVEQEALPICYGDLETLTSEQLEVVREWKENAIEI